MIILRTFKARGLPEKVLGKDSDNGMIGHILLSLDCSDAENRDFLNGLNCKTSNHCHVSFDILLKGRILQLLESVRNKGLVKVEGLICHQEDNISSLRYLILDIKYV